MRKSVPLLKPEVGDDIFQATVPVHQIDKQFDFMYFIEVMDNEGNGRTYPDFEMETPYVVVELERE